MRKLIIALALLATVSSAPAFAGRLSEATGATAGHGVNVNRVVMDMSLLAGR